MAAQAQQQLQAWREEWARDCQQAAWSAVQLVESAARAHGWVRGASGVAHRPSELDVSGGGVGVGSDDAASDGTLLLSGRVHVPPGRTRLLDVSGNAVRWARCARHSHDVHAHTRTHENAHLQAREYTHAALHPHTDFASPWASQG